MCFKEKIKYFALLVPLLLVLVRPCYAQVPHIQWQRTIGGYNDDELYSVEQTSDGGYILGGSSNSGISGDKTTNPCTNNQFDFWIVKTDCEGNIQWQKDIGGNAADIANSIRQTSDGGYIVGGYTSSGISCSKTANWFGDADWWVLKLDSVGNIQWQDDLGGSCNDYLNSVQQTADGGYILGGDSRSADGDRTVTMCGGLNCVVQSDYWVVKLNSIGLIEWQAGYGGTPQQTGSGYQYGDDNLNAIRQTRDGGYILGGASNSVASCTKTSTTYNSSYDYWVVKIDSLGTMQWQTDIGGNGTDALNDIQQTFDGGYILGGTTNSALSGNKTSNTFSNSTDYWVVKIDSLGNIQWQKDIGGAGYDGLNAIQQTTDSGYILGGFSNSDSSGNKTVNTLTAGQYDYWIVKLSNDNAGDTIQWQLDIGRNDTQAVLFGLQQTTDGGYFLGGVCNPSSANLSGKINNIGNPYGTDFGGNGTHYWIVKLGNCNSGFCGSPPPMSDSICLGDSITLNGVTEYGGFNWIVAPGGSPVTSLSCTTCLSPVASPTLTTQYVEQPAVNPNLYCSDTATVIVFAPKSIRIDTNICFGSSVQLAVPIDTGIHSILWTPALYLNNDAIVNPLCTPLADTDIQYLVKVTNNDLNHCTTLDTVDVTHYTKVSLSNPDTTVCYGGTVQIPLTGSAQYSYVWTPAKWLSSTTIPDPLSTPDSNITYGVMVTYMGCKDSASYPIYILPVSNVRIDTNICFTDSVRLNIPVIATSNPASILWTPALYLNNSTISAPLCTPLADTDIIYLVSTTVTNSGTSCVSVDTVSVTHHEKPVLANADTAICYGTTMQIPITGNALYSYSWSPAMWLDNAATIAPMATPDSNITYTLITTYMGCADTLAYPIVVEYPGNAHFIMSDSSICAGKEIVFTGDYATAGGTGIQWNFGDGSYKDNVGQLTHSYDQAGQMVVTFTATYSVCPPTSFTDTVNVFPFPIVNIGADTTLCPGQMPGVTLANIAAQAGADAGYRNTWSTGDSTATITVTTPGTYWLMVSSPNGCSTNDTMNVYPNCYVDIPNAFTPNGDGINDYFFPRQFLSDGLVSFSMDVYNRWGQLIFETTSINGRGWDGRFNNVMQPEGVYIYIIDAAFKDGKTEHHQGNITLLK